MKILVTGATGFIGGYVINELLRRKIDVIASSRNPETAKSKDWYDKVMFVPNDLMNQDKAVGLLDKFQKPDKLIHLAWTGLPAFKKLSHFEQNLLPQYFFLKSLAEDGLKEMLVTGTCLEYGMANGCLQEDMIANPSTSYGIAKDSLRRFLQQLRNENEFSFKWVRLFYMYGKGQNPSSLIPQLDMALARGDEFFNMSPGQQVRDFLPVEEVAKFLVKIALQDKEEGIINCCSGRPVKVIDFVENYIRKSGKQIKLNTGHYPYPDYEPMEFWGDSTKLERITTGYE